MPASSSCSRASCRSTSSPRQHMVPTDVQDGGHRRLGARDRRARRPAGGAAPARAASRRLGEQLDEPRPSHSFARYVDGVPYVRSITHVEGDAHPPRERGRAGPRAAADAARRPDRHDHARSRRGARARRRHDRARCSRSRASAGTGRRVRAGSSASSPRSTPRTRRSASRASASRSGMLLVNHTLTGLAIGARR